MDIKEIAVVGAGTICFIIAGVLINRAANGDYLKLLKWSITTSYVLLILSITFSLYNDYHVDSSFDFYLFGVYDTKTFIKDYFFVAFNLFFIMLQALMKMIVRWRGVNNITVEQKVNMLITISIVVNPILQIGYIGSVFNYW
ncbi:hypothetical protein A8L34_00720 [Bacillus sp. FJAT-27264]|uniref:hypothetical protein n=1 Tax=Paenibacillus sp. (strain DSM 101736 / FJAT-27264) TaxID=1850362 RepID=UPI000807C144|nr:hypothetical protein [Bacillus sp. FJAT-27264]OBZ18144.1 hypothetical protein A8L34_00720 [Bacillus sp. FJAT-27264]